MDRVFSSSGSLTLEVPKLDLPGFREEDLKRREDGAEPLRKCWLWVMEAEDLRVCGFRLAYLEFKLVGITVEG